MKHLPPHHPTPKASRKMGFVERLHKCYLNQYITIFEWGHNLKTATDDFLRALLGVPRSTSLGT